MPISRRTQALRSCLSSMPTGVLLATALLGIGPLAVTDSAAAAAGTAGAASTASTASKTGAASPADAAGAGGSTDPAAGFRPQFKPTLEVVRATGPIRIDGELDEEAWRHAARATGFAEVDPGDQIRPPVESEAWVTYDDEHLYLALIARDDPAQVRVGLHERDRIWTDDYFGLMLDTYGDHAWGYEFFVNPLGIQGDLRIDTNGNDDPSPDYIWHSRGRLTADGWQVEIAIPFASLRFPDRQEQRWRANFWRDHQRDARRRYAWAATDRDDPCWMCQWGTLTGIRGIRPRRELSAIASAVGYRDGFRAHDGSTPVDPASAGLRFDDPRGEAGLNLRYALSATSTAEATINPDFSQIESDAGRITANEPFAIYLEEKRPFFQEGIELYSTPVTAIYTRSIADPSGAAKLLGTFGRTAIAWTAAHDEQTPYLVPLAERSFVVGGTGSWSNLLRIRRAFGTDGHLGLAGTHRRAEGDAANTTIGLDGAFRFLHGLRLSGQVLASRTAEPDDSTLAPASSSQRQAFLAETFGRGGRRYTARFDGETYDGSALSAALTHSSRHWNSELSFASYSPSFRADNGFINRNDSETLNLWSGANLRPNGRTLVSWQPSLSAGRIWDHSGRFQDEWLTPELSMVFRYQTAVRTELMWSRERFREVLFPGIRRLTIAAETKPHEALTCALQADFMRTIYRTFDPATRPFLGRGTRVGLDLTLRTGSRLQFAPSLDYERLKNPEGDRLIYDGWILRNRVDLMFSPATALRLVSEYNSFDESLSVEPLLTYRLNALSVVYVGMTERYERLAPPAPAAGSGRRTVAAAAFDAMEETREGTRTDPVWRLGATQVFAKVQYLFRI